MRKGFTLVEVLIALALVGILASGLLLSGGSATSAARATTIINDLRTMKEATLLWSLNSEDYFDSAGDAIADLTPTDVLAKYLDNSGKYSESDFSFALGTDKKLYIAYKITGPNVNDIKANLAGRALSVGLLGGPDQGNTYTAGDDSVYMLVR